MSDSEYESDGCVDDDEWERRLIEKSDDREKRVLKSPEKLRNRGVQCKIEIVLKHGEGAGEDNEEDELETGSMFPGTFSNFEFLSPANVGRFRSLLSEVFSAPKESHGACMNVENMRALFRSYKQSSEPDLLEQDPADEPESIYKYRYAVYRGFYENLVDTRCAQAGLFYLQNNSSLAFKQSLLGTGQFPLNSESYFDYDIMRSLFGFCALEWYHLIPVLNRPEYYQTIEMYKRVLAVCIEKRWVTQSYGWNYDIVSTVITLWAYSPKLELLPETKKSIDEEFNRRRLLNPGGFDPVQVRHPISRFYTLWRGNRTDKKRVAFKLPRDYENHAHRDSIRFLRRHRPFRFDRCVYCENKNDCAASKYSNINKPCGARDIRYRCIPEACLHFCNCHGHRITQTRRQSDRVDLRGNLTENAKRIRASEAEEENEDEEEVPKKNRKKSKNDWIKELEKTAKTVTSPRPAQSSSSSTCMPALSYTSPASETSVYKYPMSHMHVEEEGKVNFGHLSSRLHPLVGLCVAPEFLMRENIRHKKKMLMELSKPENRVLRKMVELPHPLSKQVKKKLGGETQEAVAFMHGFLFCKDAVAEHRNPRLRWFVTNNRCAIRNCTALKEQNTPSRRRIRGDGGVLPLRFGMLLYDSPMCDWWVHERNRLMLLFYQAKTDAKMHECASCYVQDDQRYEDARAGDEGSQASSCHSEEEEEEEEEEEDEEGEGNQEAGAPWWEDSLW